MNCCILYDSLLDMLSAPPSPALCSRERLPKRILEFLCGWTFVLIHPPLEPRGFGKRISELLRRDRNLYIPDGFM